MDRGYPPRRDREAVGTGTHGKIGVLKSAHLHRAGYGLLLLYLIIAFLLRNHQTFFDEGSNLNLASCVLKGMHLYRDLFENHFPFPVYLSAAIISATGISITSTSLPMVRLAVLLIDAGFLLAAMRVSRLAFPVGFAAAVWAFISPYYFGNLLLYDNLAMIGAIALGAVCLAALAPLSENNPLQPSRGMFALLAIAGIAATLSSPFFALVTAIAIGSLFFAPRIPTSFVVKTAATIAAPIAAYFIYLSATGALGAFYSDTIAFNTTTYQKYTSVPILPMIGKQLLLFDLFNAKWFASFNPLQFNSVSFSPVFDHWIFSGLFYRIAALLACGLFALRRNYRTAVFLYLFVAALPLREDDQFHAAPFVFFCLFLTGVLLEESRSIAMVTLLAVPALVLTISGARYVARHALQSDFGRLLSEAQLIKEAARNHTDVRLGHYPYGNYMYFLTGMRPISKFVDFYPWLADIGRSEVDAELGRAPNVILAMELTGSVWNHSNTATLASEVAYAKRRLIQESAGWLTLYVSPSLTDPNGPGSEAALSALAEPIGENPFRLGGREMAIPIPGTNSVESSITVRDAATRNVLASLHPIPVHEGAWAWKPPLPHDPELTIEVIPGNSQLHWLRQPHPERASHAAVYRNGEWILYGANTTYHFGGQPGDIPVTGDWDGTGRTRPGIYQSSTGEWQLDGTHQTWHLGGQPGDIPITGDWDGMGRTKPGIYKPSTGEWILYGTKTTYHLGGQTGDIPITGDWNGDGRSKPGIYRATGEWLLYGLAKSIHYGGIPGDIPVTGDWNGDGRSKPGIFRRGSQWLLDFDGNYKFEDFGPDAVLTFGAPGDQPLSMPIYRALQAGGKVDRRPPPDISRHGLR